MNNAANTNRADKAIKAGRLAISAERIGSEDEAIAAALRCGTLAAAAGADLDTVWAALTADGIAAASLTWSTVVDAWYDAQPAVAA